MVQYWGDILTNGKSQSLIGVSTIKGPFSIAMLNYQRVITWEITTMWVKQCHKPPMTGNGLYNLTMVMTGGW